MSVRILGAVCVLIFTSSFLFAAIQDAPPRDLAEVMKMLDRYEGDYAKMRAGDVNAANRINRGLRIVKLRVGAVRDQKSDLYKATHKRFNDLIANVAAKAKSSQPAPTPAAGGKPTTPAAGPVPTLIADCNRILTRHEGDYRNMKKGDRNTAARIQRGLKMVQMKLGSYGDQKNPHWAASATRYNKLTDAVAKKAAAKPDPGPNDYDHAALDTLNKEVIKAKKSQDTLQLNVLKDPKEVERWRTMIASFRERLSVFPAGDKNTKLVAHNIRSVERVIDRCVAKLATDGAQAEFDARYKAMLAKYDRKSMPKEPQPPYNAVQVEEWVKGVRRLLEVEIPADVKWIESKVGNKLINKQRVSSARHWIGSNARRNLEQKLSSTDGNLELNYDIKVKSCDWILETDPDNRGHIANRILGEGCMDTMNGRFSEAENYIAAREAFDRGMGTVKKNAANRAEAKKKLAAARAHYAACAEKAIKELRMPKSRASDPKLAKIAADTLKKKKYGCNGWERLVVSYDMKTKEKSEGSISHGTVSSTVSVYHYKWDEFGATTAEKVGDEYYLFFNKFKFYHSGGSTTPTGYWICSNRFKTTRIAKENINK